MYFEIMSKLLVVFLFFSPPTSTKRIYSNIKINKKMTKTCNKIAKKYLKNVHVAYVRQVTCKSLKTHVKEYFFFEKKHSMRA